MWREARGAGLAGSGDRSVGSVDEPPDGLLDRCLTGGVVAVLLGERPGDSHAGLVLVDDARVDVRLPGDRRGVAEVGRDLLHGGLDRPLLRRLGVAPLRGLCQGDSSEHGGVPRAEVLGREVLGDHLRDVGVDGAGVEVGPPRLPTVGQQAGRPSPAFAHEVERLDDVRIADGDGVLDARLADEAEHEVLPSPADVPPLQGGQAERAVGVGIGVTADAEVAEVEQPGGGRGGTRERHPFGSQVADDPLTCLGQPGAGALDPVELQLVSLGPPHRVVEVLATARGIRADRLDVAVGPRTDPDVLPRRRDGQTSDALDVLLGQAGSVRVEVRKALARPATCPSLHLRGHPPQPGHARDCRCPRLVVEVARRPNHADCSGV